MIRYTLDGSSPTASSPAWPPGGIVVTASVTIKVRAVRPGIEPSLLVVEDYTWIAGPPLFVPPPGTYSGSVDATFDLGGKEVAWYTLDGSDPVPGINGTYWFMGGPAIRIEQTTTIKVMSIGGLRPSAIATGVFTIT